MPHFLSNFVIIFFASALIQVIEMCFAVVHTVVCLSIPAFECFVGHNAVLSTCEGIETFPLQYYASQVWTYLQGSS